MTSQNLVVDRVPKKSSSIPLPSNHVRRTFSEIQLEQDERMAELREGQMYHRLLTGMLRRCQQVGYHPKTTMTVQSIIKTQATVKDSTSFSAIDDDGDWLLYDSCDEVSDESSSRVHFDSVGVGIFNDSARRGSLSTIGSTTSTGHSIGIEANCMKQEDEQLIFEFDL